MIIDIRSHFKKIQKEALSREELERKVKNAMFYVETSLRKVALSKSK